VYFNVSRHITTIYLELVKACNIISNDKDMSALDLREDDHKQYKDWFKKKGIDPQKKYIVINPNASDLLYERRWPAGYFALLIEALWRQWQGNIFLVGSEEEKGYVNSILNRCSDNVKDKVINTAGAFSLLSVFALIENAMLMITNDSGLYHVAVNLSTPLVSLWGPGDPQHYGGGSGAVDKILQDTSFYCSPCLYKIESPPCRGNNLCMKALPPYDVYKSVCGLLEIEAGEDFLKMKEVFEKHYQKDTAVSLYHP
jgi:ADP-heptose:LPS heptosyltransferase